MQEGCMGSADVMAAPQEEPSDFFPSTCWLVISISMLARVLCRCWRQDRGSLVTFRVSSHTRQVVLSHAEHWARVEA